MKALRFLLGIGIVSILAPSMAIVLPDQFAAINPLNSRDNVRDDRTAPAVLAHPDLSDRGVEDKGNAGTSLHTLADLPIDIDMRPGLAEQTSTDSDLERPDDTHAETSVPAEQTSGPESTRSTDTSESNSPDSSIAGTTSANPTSTEAPKRAPSAEINERTLTGQECPCEITNTAELKGEVQLAGDLIVDGGTLIARPGVEVIGNGFEIMFMNGGKADFQGSNTSTWSNNGSSATLSRDVTFRNLRRIMFHAGAAPSVLRYISVVDSGTPGVLGDYPLHWHLNGNSTHGTLVEGVVVLNGKNHAYVPHGSHGITFKDVIAKNTTGEAIWWDFPGTGCDDRGSTCTFNNSNNTTFDHVLVDGVVPNPGPIEHHTNAGFVLGAGSGNTIRNSVALNVQGGNNCAGFHWPSEANQNVGGTVWTFSNNFARSTECHGIFVWQNEPDRHHVIKGFRGDGIAHGAYINNYEYRDIDVPNVDARAGGWSITSGRIGVLTLQPPHAIAPNDPTLAVSNTKVTKLIVDNKPKQERERDPIYEFNDIGLNCGDIQYKSIEPGTRITIDGRRCPSP